MTLHGPPRRSDGEQPPAPEHAPAGAPPGTLAHGTVGSASGQAHQADPARAGAPLNEPGPAYGPAPGQAVGPPVPGLVGPGQNAAHARVALPGQVAPGQQYAPAQAAPQGLPYGHGHPYGAGQPYGPGQVVAPGHQHASGQVAPGQPYGPGYAVASGQQQAPGHAVPGHAVPGHAVAGHAVPGHAVPGHAVPGHAVPGHAVQGQGMAPAQAIPAQGVPAQGADTAADTAATTRIGAPAVVGGRSAEQVAAAAAAAAAGAVAYSPAIAPAAAPASLVPPRPPETGTVYTGTGGGPDGRDRFGQRRIRQSLRIGAHTASDRALELLGMAIPGAGLVLGYDIDQTTASIRLFRPEPTRVALVGGEWACHVIALRALALGARVAVFTTTPERWDGFGEWATGRTGRVATFSLDQSVVVAASAHEPALLLYDAGLTGVASNVPLGPWQTRLTVLRQLTSYGIPAIQEANMVLAQRLTRAETEVVTSTMRLSSEAGGWMQTLNDDAMAVIVGGEERYVRLTLASLEQQLGAPRR